jgi:hypothetical protein
MQLPPEDAFGVPRNMWFLEIAVNFCFLPTTISTGAASPLHRPSLTAKKSRETPRDLANKIPGLSRRGSLFYPVEDRIRWRGIDPMRWRGIDHMRWRGIDHMRWRGIDPMRWRGIDPMRWRGIDHMRWRGIDPMRWRSIDDMR